MKRVGAVIFDNPDERGAGWACRSPEEPFRFRSFNDLPGDTAWITKLNYEQTQGFKHNNLPRFRNADFFRTSIDGIMKEVGLSEFAPARDLVYTLSSIFHSTMVAARRFGLEDVPPTSLARGFRFQFFDRRYGVRGTENAVTIIERALKAYTNCPPSGQREKNAMSFSLYRHRPSHAQDILSLPIPDGRWTPVPKDLQPKTREEIANYPVPLLLRVISHAKDPIIASILNLATPEDAGSRFNREWIPHHEFDAISDHAELEVIDMMAAERYVNSPIIIDPVNRWEEISYSFGLCMESIWTACYKDLKGRIDNAPAAVWTQSMDRILCLTDVLRIVKRAPGILVNGYGYGRINLSVPFRGDHIIAQDLARIVNQSELITPLNHRHPYRDPVNASMRPHEIMQQIMLRGARQSILIGDEKVTAELLRRLARRDSQGGMDAPPPAVEPAEEIVVPKIIERVRRIMPGADM